MGKPILKGNMHMKQAMDFHTLWKCALDPTIAWLVIQWVHLPQLMFDGGGTHGYSAVFIDLIWHALGIHRHIVCGSDNQLVHLGHDHRGVQNVA